MSETTETVNERCIPRDVWDEFFVSTLGTMDGEKMARAIIALRARVRELEKCAAFVQWVRQEWHCDGDIDGGALQDALTDCGLLTPVEVTAPCDPETCQCAEYADFPVTCYRWSALPA